MANLCYGSEEEGSSQDNSATMTPTESDLLAMSGLPEVVIVRAHFFLVLDETGGMSKKTAAAFVALGLQAM
jgi:hypothetical protein